jgi:hypothetical protein
MIRTTLRRTFRRMRAVRGRPRWTAALTAILVITALPLSVAPPAVADGAAPTISFRVVEPDGTPVVRPVVVVSVFGPTYRDVRVLAGGAAGQVVVPFPADDPAAAAKLAAGEATNLLIRVFDKTPGSADINAAYVGAAIGVDAFGTLRELSKVTGSVIMLEPGRTDFHTVTGGVGVVGAAHPWEPQPDYCPTPNDIEAPYACDVVDYPDWVKNTLVTIATNHGAGNDMTSALTYSTTRNTTTEVAAQVGSAGFFETNGSVAYEKANAVTLGFASRGPDDNADAFVSSTFERRRAGWCMYVQNAWQCQIETTYRPYQAIGSYSQGDWRLNDHMDPGPNRDCWTEVDGRFEPTAKSEVRYGFSLRLGPDENWSIATQGILYANSTVTQQVGKGKSFIRSWVVNDSHTYPYHYVYVPNGLVGSPPGTYPNSQCLIDHLGEVQTAAEWTREALAVAQPSGAPPVPYPPSDPTNDEQKADHPVCGNKPDACD